MLATVLFTDIVGSTELASTVGDRRWRQLLARHNAMVRRLLKRYQGRELDTAGDGFFAMFDRPADAVECATAIVRNIRSLGIEVRAGVHTGECEVMDHKVGGMAVHVAARIVALAGPGEVLVSRTLQELLAGSEISFEDRGVHALKGLPSEWRLYRASVSEPGTIDDAELAGDSTGVHRSSRALALVAGLTALVVLAAVLFVIARRGDGDGAGAGPPSQAETTPAAAPSPGTRLLRLDPGVHGTLLQSIDLDGAPTGVAVGEGSVWVAIEDGTVLTTEFVVAETTDSVASSRFVAHTVAGPTAMDTGTHSA